ncbi:ADP-ribosylation factor 1-like [Mizuhopecten yessoensis]|uniref:ADP-ribosylation factor 1 n=1 Tax=Mizuhopecten yessoensis TaxID=6573 RepID=A0A210Q9L5_MIZYE|nr:ADP-ribosylation factor 1-like [Mizuhopecten yessoensis]OWF45432.1 ADP-ribosylation factor 1 [Mizuhopecten yessoensis]
MGAIWTKIFRNKEVRVLLLGLDAVGKTTLLYRLKLGEFNLVIPTIGFNVESIQYKDINFTAWDIGSRDKMRPLFRHYYKGTEAVVIVIDSHDKERLDELNHDVIKPALQAEELSSACFLFLANKCDMEPHMSSEEIHDRLGLRQLKHTWNLFHVSALRGDGLTEALDWLAFQLGSEEIRKSVTPESEDKMDKALSGLPYCSRAYTAIKCLFFRPTRQDRQDEGR